MWSVNFTERRAWLLSLWTNEGRDLPPEIYVTRQFLLPFRENIKLSQLWLPLLFSVSKSRQINISWIDLEISIFGYPAFQPLTKCFFFQARENLSISFNYIRFTSVSHIPAYPDFLFRKMIKSISFMENETEVAIKMWKLKKTNSSPFGNRACLLHWCLIVLLMKTNIRKWSETFPDKQT